LVDISRLQLNQELYADIVLASLLGNYQHKHVVFTCNYTVLYCLYFVDTVSRTQRTVRISLLRICRTAQHWTRKQARQR